MKLTTTDISNLQVILCTCLIGGIDSIIIEDGWVRGKNEASTYIIFSNNSIPALSMKMGLSKLSSLKQRLDLFAGRDTVIEAKESDRGEISLLEISSGRNKVQFRCTSTMLIKAPRGINDNPEFKIYLKKDETKLIMNAVKVMGGKIVQLIIKADRSAHIVLTSESTNDAFTAALETPAEILGDESNSAVHYYHADIFYAALKTSTEADLITLEIGTSGTIRYKINNHAVVLMPRVNDEEEED